MKIDHEIEPPPAEIASDAEIVCDSSDARRQGHDDHLIQVGVVADDRGGGFFNEVADPGLRKTAPEGSDGRRREDHVANHPEPDQENLHRTRAYGSMVASSSSITGMSSLTG